MSRVITREQLEQGGRSPVALNLQDVEEKARQAVEQAKAEARRILAEAAARAKEIESLASARGERAGYEVGTKKGVEAGRAEAYEAEADRVRQETAELRAALLEILGEVEAHRHEVVAEARINLIDLAVAIAGRICRARIEVDRDHLRPLVEEVIESAVRPSGLVLRVNPADAGAIGEFLADVHGAASPDGDGAVRLVADERVEAGGCVAECRGGRIDAQVESQIKQIVSELMGPGAATQAGVGGPS